MLLFGQYLLSPLSVFHSPRERLHFQYSTAAALVKVTDDFSIAKSNGHCSAKLTEPISRFHLVVDYCLLLESLSSTDLWNTSLLVLLLPTRLFLLELLCHPLNVRGSVPRSLLVSMYTHSLGDLIQPTGLRHHLHVDNSKI